MKPALRYLWIFLIPLIFSGTAVATVQLGSGLVINQSGSNATINVTSTFNATNLTVYDDATRFGSTNFSVVQGDGSDVDVRLDYINGSEPAVNTVANFSADSSSSNNVTFDFSGLFSNSLYEAYQNQSYLLRRGDSTGSGSFSFYNDYWSTGFQEFELKNVDNLIPAFNSTEIRDDRKSNVLRLILGIDNRGETDIASFTGSGSTIQFTNTTLELGKTLPIDDNYTVTDFKSASSTERSVDVSTTESGVQEDDYDSNLSFQQVNESVTVSNDGSSSVSYNLTLQNRGTVVTSESWIFTVSQGGTATKTGVWSGDWINEKVFDFSVVPNEVDLDSTYTGVRALQLEETKSVAWNNLSTTGFVSTPSTCSQSNSTTVSLSSGATVNKSIGFSCDPGSIGSPALTPVNKSGYERYWWNTTLQVDSNLTDGHRLVWPSAESNLNKWDDRDAGSANAYINEKSSDLEIVDGSGTAYVKVQTDFSNSSLHKGSHPASLTWTYGKDSDDGGSGGGGGSSGGGSTGGGGDSGTDQTPSGDEEVTIGWSRTELNGIPGQVTPGSFTVRNLIPQKNTVSIVKAGGTGCQFVQVESATTIQQLPSGRPITVGSNEFSDTGSYNIPPSTASPQSGFYSTAVDVRVRLPRRERIRDDFGGRDTFTCDFTASTPTGRAKNLTLTLTPRATVESLLNKFYVDYIPDFLRNDQPLLVERSICLSPSSGAENQCPDGAQYRLPTPAANPVSLAVSILLLGLTLGVLRVVYFIGWKKGILWK